MMLRSRTNPCQVHALVVPLVSRPHCVAVRPAFRRPDRTPDSRDIVDQRDHVGRGTAPGSAGEAGELRRPEEKALGLPSARPRPHAVAYPACHARPRNGGPRRCTTRERPRAYNARRSGAGPGRRSHSIAPCATCAVSPPGMASTVLHPHVGTTPGITCAAIHDNATPRRRCPAPAPTRVRFMPLFDAAFIAPPPSPTGFCRSSRARPSRSRRRGPASVAPPARPLPSSVARHPTAPTARRSAAL